MILFLNYDLSYEFDDTQYIAVVTLRDKEFYKQGKMK